MLQNNEARRLLGQCKVCYVVAPEDADLDVAYSHNLMRLRDSHAPSL
jgi:hypothetical protein